MNPGHMVFDPDSALPNVAYRDPAIFAAELEAIWHGDWVFVTTIDAVPNPGDQLPVVIGTQPVLLIRQQNGDLAAVSNLCAHRGTLLVDRPTNAKRIQCPYHAWTYDGGGRLLSVPHAPRDAVDKSAHCLPTYRVESWHGLIFVSQNLDAEPLATRFAAVEPYVAERGLDAMAHRSELQETQEWACNWKLAILNAMESYHLFRVHPETLEPVSPTKGAYYVSGSARATATGGTVKGSDDYLLVSLPPGFVGVFTSGAFAWQAVHPIDVERCAIRTGAAWGAASGTRPRNRIASWLSRRVAASAYGLPDFLPEDKAICERGQRGAIGDFTPGPLVPVERVVADFGHYLNWRLHGVEPPAVHTAIDAGENR